MLVFGGADFYRFVTDLCISLAKLLASCSLGSGACSGARPVSCTKPCDLLKDPKPS